MINENFLNEKIFRRRADQLSAAARRRTNIGGASKMTVGPYYRLLLIVEMLARSLLKRYGSGHTGTDEAERCPAIDRS